MAAMTAAANVNARQSATSVTGGAAALSYATVYPLVMFLRIITPQLLAVLFWGLGQAF